MATFPTSCKTLLSVNGIAIQQNQGFEKENENHSYLGSLHVGNLLTNVPCLKYGTLKIPWGNFYGQFSNSIVDFIEIRE